jgi:hypothetical protein
MSWTALIWRARLRCAGRFSCDPRFGNIRASASANSPGVAYIPKPWQPFNVLIAAEQALATRV